MSSYHDLAHTTAAAMPFMEYDEYDVEWRSDTSLSTPRQLITSQIAVRLCPSVACACDAF